MIQIKKASAHTSKRYWSSVRQLNNAPVLSEFMDQEFPGGAPGATSDPALDEPSRRHLFKIMGASLALAGLTACRRPEEHILPLARGVEDYVPGQKYFYSTAMNIAGRATGLLAEVNDFRPTKIEGHPAHPASKGAASSFHQASVLSLYDPDRSKNVLKQGLYASWDDFTSSIAPIAAQFGSGATLRILSERNPSPSMAAIREQAAKKYPAMKWVEYEPAAPDTGREGTQLAFGQPVDPAYKLQDAKLIVSLDADFLGIDNANLADIKGHAASRRVLDEQHAAEMSRLYVIEANYSVTGMNSDHRLRVKPSEVAVVARALAASLGIAPAGPGFASADPKRDKFLAVLAKDLQAAGSHAVVIAGPRQPAAIHALAALMNEKLGAIGTTVDYLPAVTTTAPQLAALRDLVGDMAAGRVETLVILAGNPVFSAPSDLGFADALKKVKTSIHLNAELNETGDACTWHLPEAHFLEAWGDQRALDGSVTIQQPMIQPLFEGKSALEVMALIFDLPQKRGYDIVRSNWLDQVGGEEGWKKAVHDGLVPGQELKPVAVKGNPAAVTAALAAAPTAEGFQIQFAPSFHVFDGRYANNAWLQECPEPITKITWGNAALMSPATARKLGVFPEWMEPKDKADHKIGENWDRSINTEDPAVEISKGGRSVRLPVFVVPGHADDTVTLSYGYGRKTVGSVGQGYVTREIFPWAEPERGKVGVDVYPLRTTADFGFGTGFTVKASGMMPRLATTQDHFEVAGRPFVREASIEEYRKEPSVIAEMNEVPELIQLYESKDYSKGYQWGMAIDLNACIGCNACVVACQAENNIPVVGREGVMRGREMHWIRLDRYFSGTEEEPEAIVQPLNCLQCENAPCENVCPVAATVHSPEGLNDMAYNRCVGTRYCSNNCPVKVRRFNYFNYHKDLENKPQLEVMKMVYNPDVTVRMRGVMEKCTYCVQRIQEKKIAAKIDGRRQVRDGEIQSACQQTCPADAITFGDINDPNSRVSKLKKQQRNYAMLAEINIRPRTTFLAKLRNPHPELV